MNELDPKARELITKGSRGLTLDDAKRAELRTKLLTRVAALDGQPPASPPTLSTRVLEMLRRWTEGRALLVAASLSLGGVALWVTRTVSPPSTVEMKDAPTTLPNTAAHVEASPRPPVESRKPRHAVTAPPPATALAEDRAATLPQSASSTLKEELTLLTGVFRALRAGDGGAARAHLDEHARRFPQGVLGRERQALLELLACHREASASKDLPADPALAELFEAARAWCPVEPGAPPQGPSVDFVTETPPTEDSSRQKGVTK